MVPGEGFKGISAVEAGKAAALVSVFPGADVHELPGVELPSAGGGATVPVVLLVTVPTIATGMAAGRVGDGLVLLAAGGNMPPIAPMALVAAAGFTDTVLVVAVTLATDGESSTSVGAQLTVVPGSAGSCASGGEARAVAGAPGTVEAEKRLVNGLGPVSGEDTMAPGVVGMAMAVVPMVETWARQLLLAARRAAAAQMCLRIKIPHDRFAESRRKQSGGQIQFTFESGALRHSNCNSL